MVPLAGKAGFEPTMPAPKTSALTTWRLPFLCKKTNRLIEFRKDSTYLLLF